MKPSIRSLIFTTFLMSTFTASLHGQMPTGVEVKSDPAKVLAETEKLKAEKSKLESEASYYRNAQWFTLVQYLIGFAALAIPALIAVRQLAEQRRAQQERARTDSELLAIRARVDASLKAAEIAMNAPTTGQIRSRAQILSTLLQDLVPDFGKTLAGLDFTKIGLASYRSRFSTLLDAIASEPDHALLFVEIYDTLFPEDDANSHGCIAALLRQLRARQAQSHS
jgi:hypothetical protein